MRNKSLAFRAWNHADKVMEVVADLYWFEENGVHDGSGEGTYRQFHIMQFTGLKDKNGKEIFEGDIVSFAGNMTADDSLGVEPNGFIYDEDSKHEIEWSDEWAAWQPKFNDDDSTKYRNHTRNLLVEGRCEVIGNIYEK